MTSVPAPFLPLRSGLLHLLVLAADREAAHVHRDRDHDLGVPGRLPGLVVDVAGLDPLPLGAPVLEPDLHLHLAQLERVRDVRALRERQVLLAEELLLQLQQLLAGESRPSPAALPRRAAGRQRLLRARFEFALLGQRGAAVVAVRETFVLAVRGAVLPVAARRVRGFQVQLLVVRAVQFGLALEMGKEKETFESL